MRDVVVKQPSPEVTQRARQAEARLRTAKAQMEDSFYTICQLLHEVRDNGYHQVYGYSSFEKWIESSDLDLSAREAYYYSSIAKKAHKLGLDRSDIAPIKVSKLKKIFTLDPKTHRREIQQLLAKAATENLQAISDRVLEIRRSRDRKAH